ncbi:outer membrane protein [Reyranella sp.]|uniref:outer membrane protein n=1 Tax=Reyranella sp. TaxID=1929291 RepID=UPI003BABD7A2
MSTAIRALVIAGVMAGFCPSLVQAQETGVPASGFYAGAGVSANLVVPTNQTIFSQGVSNVFQGSTLAAYGAAGGPTNPRPPTAATISPSAQLGYFQRLNESRWLLGGKLTYNYIAATATDHYVAVPQIGSFTQVPGGPITAFTGNVVVRSYQITADHQIALVPYVGYTFDRSYVYFGAGPSLTHTDVKLSHVVGYADINGAVGTNITGAPATYSSEQWLIGATFAVGATYFLTPSWFVDFGYAFTITDLWNPTYSSPFSNDPMAAGVTYQTSGVLSGSYTGGLNTHALTVSINRRF